MEKIPSKIDGQSGYEQIGYEGINTTFDQMPTNTFTDLQTNKTFANIPTDVFDQIPRAVTAREEKRLLKFQERLLQEKKASEKEENMVRNLKQPPPVLPDFMM